MASHRHHIIWIVTIFLLRHTYSEEQTYNSTSKESQSLEDFRESEEKRDSEGWAEWSSWSVCSRTCDGGVTYQLRKCQSKSGCQGETTKHRICNMQPCHDPRDFRATQCAAYNTVPYRGRLYEWLPYHDPEDPCSLTCQAHSFSFVAKLATRVRDGTRCREGSLDMCVAGKCLAIGCDLQLGSTKTVDECGVCGGNGSTCRRPVYVWGDTPFSPCSVTCGGGYQMSRPICLNKETGKEVDERLCDVTSRPRPQIRECNKHVCPAVWISESWSLCSVTCGGGRQTRHVYCAQGDPNGTLIPVSGGHCPRQKPLTERPCNLHHCPRWIEGHWSGCSVTCGHGYQTRSIVCRDARGHHSTDCSSASMPLTKQTCTTGISCVASQDSEKMEDPNKGSQSQEDAPPPSPFYSLPWTQKLMGPSPISTEPSFIAGEWGPCSATCGEGSRQRTVECKIFLEFSRTIAKLPDKECPGPRPEEVEHCFSRPCALGQNKIVENVVPKGQVGIEVTYSWRMAGFTPCSASCLGGTRESLIQCVRDHDQSVISLYLCDITRKPEAITQTCNDHPCPPRWNISEFSPCTKHCGAGLQTREVQCLHEVTRGSSNILVVPNYLCPQPPPRAKQFCNVFDCPTRWHAEAWSKCSRSCGGGVKKRKIKCQKEQAFGQVIELAPSSCSKRRPKVEKPCNNKPCPDETKKPQIYVSHQTYIQQQPQRKVYLKVGGRAVVFKGTNLKIRCPSRQINKTNIIWYKNNDKIISDKRVLVSRKGALRIRKIAYSDTGTYTCVAGFSKADINITVKPLPPGHGRSEEDRTVERPVIPSRDEDSDPSTNEEIEDDYSHEHHQPSKSHDKNRVLNPPRHKIKITNMTPKEHVDTIVDHPEIEWTKQQGHRNKTKSRSKSKLKETKITPFIPPTTVTTVTIPTTIATTTEPTTIANLQSTTPSTTTVTEHTVTNEEMSSTPFDSWVGSHGGDLFSDQESDEFNVGTSRENNGMETEQPASSGATSTHALPHIQQLLVNLHHTLGGSRTHMYNSHSFEDDEELNPANIMSNSFVLGKGNAENLEFDWMTTDWSPCSEPCGGNGFQVRASQCLVRLNNVSKSVDSRLCADAGLEHPITIKKCGGDDCPHWATGQWSACAETSCFTWHTAYQKREVYCRLKDGTNIDVSKCDERTRPRRKRECYNDRCKGTWKVGDWSECSAECSEQGFQTRLLQCVWFGTKKPAGNACRDQPRPSVMRPCRGPTCSPRADCVDHSKYCGLAKTLQMCRLSHYRHDCCKTCRAR